MNRTDLSQEEFNGLLKAIAPIIMERGLKATTMDIVAQHLGMSKRTLYEIFESKTQMTDEVLEYLHFIHVDAMHEAFRSSATVLEAMIKVNSMHREEMKNVNVNFFRDMDKYYKDMRGKYRIREADRNGELVKMCLLGVEQGVFRPDVNYKIQTRIFEIQMESLKRMEELFPPDITRAEVYDTISMGFLRSIVTPKGMEMLESFNLSHADNGD